MNKNKVTFILHKPQLSENIGACARAIKNFNFQKLYLIDPKPIFPNDKILATSVGAKDIIRKSEVYKTLEPVVKKFDYLIATTARFRNKNIKHLLISDLKKLNFNKKIGFIFGSEASGLTNNEISYANYTLNIPTNDKFRSLNLSHSVIIIAQIVSSIINLNVQNFSKSKKIDDASKKNIHRLASFVIDNLEQIKFFRPAEKKSIMLENLRSIFYKMQLSEKEIRILSSVFAQFLKKKVN